MRIIIFFDKRMRTFEMASIYFYMFEWSWV